MLSTYEIALNDSRKATKVYQIAAAAYRAGNIDDAEFLAAQAAYKIASAKYDKAFAIAQTEVR